ncbi:MAG: LTA synthase family protein [Clostridiaceae bacterium]|nr:LTA synthase family protein [Clostridiaceae bacterium]
MIVAECFYWLLFIASIMVKCFYFQYTTKVNTLPFDKPLNVNMLKSSFAVIIIISSIIFFLFNRKRILVVMVADLFLSWLLIADTIYFRYYSNAITVPVLYQVGLIGPITESIKTLFKVKDVVYVLDLPVMIAGFIFLNKKGIEDIRIPIRALAMIVLVVLSTLQVRWVYNRAENVKFAYDNNFVIENMGILYFHGFDIKRFVKENFFEDRTLTEAEKNEIDNFYKEKKPVGDRLRGSEKGKNLIIVQVEALQGFVMNRTINGKEITPNLNRLARNSYYFDRIYHQVAGGNTSDAEFLTNVSLHPAKEGAVYFRYPNNHYESLPKVLKAKGYDTYVFHGFRPSFWNRTVMYKALGFDTYMSLDDYVVDEKVGWAISDASFFRQSLDRIDMSKPFYGFFITLSSHHPYDAFINYDFDVGEYEGTQLGNFLKAANYVDKCIGDLVQQLKDRGIYENTLLVIYGDHSALFEDQVADLTKFLGFEYSELEWTKIQKVPLLIHSSGIKDTEPIHVTGGEIDILPTIANLMDFEVPFALGKDLLNTDRGYAVLRNGSVVMDDVIYLSKTDEIYSLETGQPVEDEGYRQEIERLRKELDISDIILQKNALKR